jgi:hypothetical protein
MLCLSYYLLFIVTAKKLLPAQARDTVALVQKWAWFGSNVGVVINRALRAQPHNILPPQPITSSYAPAMSK